MTTSERCVVVGWGRTAALGGRGHWVGLRLGALLLLWLVALSGRAQTPLLQLSLQGTASTIADPTFIYLQAGATTGFDNDYDASKLSNPNGLNLASLTATGQQLAINGLPPSFFATNSTVDLFVGVPQDDQYTLTVSQLDNFGFSNVYLVDAQLQTRQAVTTGFAYSFALNSANTGGTYATNTRFSLVFEPTGVAPLPVVLVAFAAQRQGASGLLTWATASELHNVYFQVESSSDGTTFTALGRVAGAGTSAAAHTYQFLDANLARYAAPLVYYRLRQVDSNGTSTYSPVRTLAILRPISLAVKVIPSPGQPTNEIALTVDTNQAGPATWLLTDGLGRVVRQQELTLRDGTTTLPPISIGDLAPGLYLLRVQQGQQHQTLRVVR
jgi:hypothetical protein